MGKRCRAYKDPRVPLYARIFAACVIGYAFSPIDLIPDVIPVLGYLDDLVIVPLGIAIAVKMIPPDVMVDCQERSRLLAAQQRPVNKAAAVVVVAIWIALAALAVTVLLRQMAY
ncbi:MAG: YkvA family protein [Chloroflexi bacterium]|nr:YkvA family protein [Chloroflexota bacterium]